VTVVQTTRFAARHTVIRQTKTLADAAGNSRQEEAATDGREGQSSPRFAGCPEMRRPPLPVTKVGNPMSMDTIVQCVCGHQIGLNELLAHGFVMVGEKPAHVYLKYRCAVCGHEGVELIDYDKWNAMMKEPDLPVEEVNALAGLGPIDAGEMLEFTEELAQVTADHFIELYSI